MQGAGGVLVGRDARRYEVQAIAQLFRDASSRTRWLLRREPQQRFDLDSSAPSTELAQRATAWAEQTHEPWLLAHSLRTWGFARLFAQADGLEVDAETLYLACLLHDTGLTDEGRIAAGEGCGCFALHGAHVSESLLIEWDADPAQAAEVAQAIALHLNVTVPRVHGASAHLLSQGVGLDCVGARAADVGREAITSVVRSYDRTRFPALLIERLGAEARERPQSRTGALWRVGFPLAIRMNPINRLK